MLDLRKRFGGRYRVTPSDEAPGGRDDPACQQIVTATGLVYAYDDDTLGVQVDGHPRIAGRLRRMGYPLLQDGDTEKTFLVPAADLDRVAPVVRPRRRPALTAAGRERLREAGRTAGAAALAAHRGRLRASLRRGSAEPRDTIAP